MMFLLVPYISLCADICVMNALSVLFWTLCLCLFWVFHEYPALLYSSTIRLIYDRSKPQWHYFVV